MILIRHAIVDSIKNDLVAGRNKYKKYTDRNIQNTLTSSKEFHIVDDLPDSGLFEPS